MSMCAFDIAETLRKRRDELLRRKDDIIRKTNSQSEQLSILFKKVKPIRFTIEHLNQQIEDLEAQRISHSLSLTDEKSILRKIDRINHMKRKVEENNECKQKIKEKKAQIEALRLDTRNLSVQLNEIHTAFDKVNLAKRLGCSIYDLKSVTIDCHCDKIGEVIGKGGRTIKKIESETGCIIDVMNGKIRLTGLTSAIERCSVLIERILLDTEDSILLCRSMHGYLIGNRMKAYKDMQSRHPNVSFGLDKKSVVMKIRGSAKDIVNVKCEISLFEAATERLIISDRDAAVVIGRSGSNVTELEEKFNVRVEVTKKSDSESVVEIMGIASDVSACKVNIEEIVNLNKEVSSSILVNTVLRDMIFEKTGKIMKQMQSHIKKKLGIKTLQLLMGVKTVESDETTFLVVKTLRRHHSAAMKMIQEQIDEYESRVLVTRVDKFLIPVIIGKKGTMINELKRIGNGAGIEVNGLSCEVSVIGPTSEDTNRVKAAIDVIIANNQRIHLQFDPKIINFIFGYYGRDLCKQISRSGVQFRKDGPGKVVFCGNVEMITEATEILQRYAAENYIDEIPYESSDTFVLLRFISKMKDVQANSNVIITLLRSRSVVQCRGVCEHVQLAVQKIKTFLYGDNNFIVEKFVIPRNMVGVMIGSQGCNVNRYEQRFSVNLEISSNSGLVAIRGQAIDVFNCREILLNEMISSHTFDTLSITQESIAFLEVPDNFRKISHGLPVDIHFSFNAIKLRGICYDVEILKEAIQAIDSKTFETKVRLLPNNFASLNRDPILSLQHRFHIDLEFESENFTLVMKGEMRQVKRFKAELYDLFGKSFPNYASIVKVHYHLGKVAGDTKALVSISAETGAFITYDHSVSMFLIQARSTSLLTKGIQELERRIEACRRLVFVHKIEACESWMIASLSDQHRQRLIEIEQSTMCTIEVCKDQLLFAVSGKDEKQVAIAQTRLLAFIDRLKKENVFLDIPEKSIDSFLMESHRMASKYGVKVGVVKNRCSRIYIKGSIIAVSKALNAINDWILKWEGIRKQKSAKITDNLLPQDYCDRISETPFDEKNDESKALHTSRHVQSQTVSEIFNFLVSDGDL